MPSKEVSGSASISFQEDAVEDIAYCEQLGIITVGNRHSLLEPELHVFIHKALKVSR